MGTGKSNISSETTTASQVLPPPNRDSTSNSTASLSRMNNGRFQYHKLPKWYPSRAPTPTTKLLNPTGHRYPDISGRFLRTAGACTVLKIERVMHNLLYTNYAQQHEELSAKARKSVRIQMLFLGTQTTDPSALYLSPYGLDSWKQRGSAGLGTYYSINSSRAISSAFICRDGSRQVLCCSVIVGESVRNYSENGQFHSVKTKEGGDDVIVVYEPKRSYPFFLITFR